MKRVLKMVGGFVAAVALVCVLGTSAQARTFGWFSFGFPAYCAPAYYSGYCNPYPYARPAYRYCYAPPVYYYGGGCWYRR